MDEHYVIGAEGVGVHLDGVDAVFLGIELADGLGGQLAGLAHGNEADAELCGHCSCDYEAAGLDSGDFRDALAAVQVAGGIDYLIETLSVLEQCRDVEKRYPLDGIIRHRTEILNQIFLIHTIKIVLNKESHPERRVCFIHNF